MKSYKGTATLADSKSCAALAVLARKIMPQNSRESLAIQYARIPGCKATVLAEEITFALTNSVNHLEFLDRVYAVADPSNKHVVRDIIDDEVFEAREASNQVLAEIQAIDLVRGDYGTAFKVAVKEAVAGVAAGKSQQYPTAKAFFSYLKAVAAAVNAVPVATLEKVMAMADGKARKASASVAQ